MSFQAEEQEFDFSYMLEYSQDRQNEPGTGGYSSAALLFCVLCPVYCKSSVNQDLRSHYVSVEKILTFSVLLTERRSLFSL